MKKRAALHSAVTAATVQALSSHPRLRGPVDDDGEMDDDAQYVHEQEFPEMGKLMTTLVNCYTHCIHTVKMASRVNLFHVK